MIFFLIPPEQKKYTMSLELDLKESREHEMRVYLNSMKAMYENSLLQNGEIYDIAANLTDDFTRITSQAILEDSRFIKILRYAIAPSISQMKFGQFFGLTSIDKYENDRLRPRNTKHGNLSAIADDIASFINDNLDQTRFIWPKEDISASERTLAIDYAKRIKECCDKSNDWRSSTYLDDPMIIAVIAGFFNITGIQNLQASGIQVVWEHRLTDLGEVL